MAKPNDQLALVDQPRVPLPGQGAASMEEASKEAALRILGSVWSVEEPPAPARQLHPWLIFEAVGAE